MLSYHFALKRKSWINAYTKKVSRSKISFLILYVDDLLFATNDKSMQHEIKQFLSKNFKIKDIGDASYVIGINIYQDRTYRILGLSQETYINKNFRETLNEGSFTKCSSCRKG